MPSDQPRAAEEPAARGGPCTGRPGAPYAEAWGYFHLAAARPGRPSGRWATCRLCGEQVGRAPGLPAGTAALWRHLKSAHRRELEGGGAAAERERARRREQVGALAERARRRERELARREAAVARGERALERGRRALRELERRLRAERGALRAWLLALGRPAGPPAAAPKEDPAGLPGLSQSWRQCRTEVAAPGGPGAAPREEATERRPRPCSMCPRAEPARGGRGSADRGFHP